MSDAPEATIKWAGEALAQLNMRGAPDTLPVPENAALGFELKAAPGAWTFAPRTGAQLTRLKMSPEGGLQRVEIVLDSPAAPSRNVFELSADGDRLALQAVAGGVSASLAHNDEGRLKRVRLADGGAAFDTGADAAAQQSATKTATGMTYYSLHKDERGSFFSAAPIPYYYLNGSSKKRDIREDWNGHFAAAAAEVIDQGATLLGHDRLYTLWQAVRNVRGLDGAIVEVGVLRGGSTKLLAMAQRHFGKSGKIYSCDTFTGHAHVEEDKDARHKIGSFGERTRLEDVQALLKDEAAVTILPGAIEDMAASIAGGVALLHLDVDVYPTTKFCLEYFYPRMPAGGAFIIDDYAVSSCPGVQEAVDAFVADLSPGSATFMHLLSGQALLQKLA